MTVPSSLARHGTQTMQGSQGERVAEELAHRVAYGERRRAGQIIMDLEQVRLYIRVGGIKDEVRVRPARHLWHVLVPVDDLRNEDDLVLKHLDDGLVPAALVARLGQLAVDGPHLPGHALRLEGPARAPPLEELEADRAARRLLRVRPRLARPQQLRELRDVALHGAP